MGAILQMCYGEEKVKAPYNHIIDGLVKAILQSNLENECTRRLQTSVNNFMADATLSKMVEFSGKSSSDLGMYEQCINTAGFTYIGLSVYLYSTYFVSNIGICSPHECDVPFYDSLKPALAVMFNRLQASLNITSEMIIFTNVLEANHEISQITYGKVIGIAVLLSIALFCVISTVVDKYISSTNSSRALNAMRCFSLTRNASAILFSKNTVDANLDVLNGVKMISCYWIIIGNCFTLTVVGGPVMNIADSSEAYNNMFGTLITSNSQIYVDAFFMISAFLATLKFTTALSHSANLNFKYVLKCYARRYLRLIPMYVCVFILSYSVLNGVSSGPVFYQSRYSIPMKCTKYWWANLLFANNYLSAENMCFFWTWYLANDFQFFIINSGLSWAYTKSKRLGCLLVLSILALSFGITIVLSYKYKLSIFATNSISQPPPKYNYYNVIYYRPYTRIPVYLIGVLMSWAYLSYKDKRFSFPIWDFINNLVHIKLFRHIIYILAMILLSIVLFSYSLFHIKPEKLTDFENMVFIVFRKPLFVSVLVLIVYPTMVGHGKLLLNMLGSRLCNAISKLSYSILMVNLLVFTFYEYTSRQLIEYSILFMITLGLDVFLASMGIGFVASLLFDSPMKQLLGIILTDDGNSGHIISLSKSHAKGDEKYPFEKDSMELATIEITNAKLDM